MGLLLWLVPLFPFAELYVLIRVGARIGFFNTLLLLIISAVLGSYLARVQGAAALQRIQACLAAGRMPTRDMADALLVFVGGLLFIFPGFISDALGLLLIFPLTRILIREVVLAGMKRGLAEGKEGPPPRAPKGPGRPRPRGRGHVEDAEIVE